MTQHKELPVLPITPLQAWWDSGNEQFIELEMLFKAYGAACAAHAREIALEEAKQVAENCDVVEVKGNTYYAQLGDAAATQRGIVSAIEALKGK